MAMRILVVGAGAVGGYFGGQRAAELRAKGLEIASPHGNATLTPTIITPEEMTSRYDLVLLAVKGYSLDGAITDFASAIGDNSAILPVLNGMRHIGVLSDRFGGHSVLGGACIVSNTLDDKGRVLQLTDTQELVYGELDGKRSSRLSELDRVLQGAGFVARPSANIVGEMWEKWVFAAALGGITCLLRGSIGEIAISPRGRDLALAMLEECIQVAAACGQSPRPETIERIRGALTDSGSLLTLSMYRDLQKGAPTEADTIIGDMCMRGDAAGLKMPLLAAAYAQLSI
jgi:2-dehydropantoate 2-reductase